MNRTAGTTLVVGFVAWSLAAGAAPAATPSAAEVVARNVAARGGLEAWRKVETMVWRGHILSAHAPAPSLPFELDQKRPNKTRLQIDVMGDESVRVFDGLHGWKLRPGRGRPEAEPYTAQELRSAQAGHGLEGPLIDHAAKGHSVTLEGIDEVEGRRAYHLDVHLAKGGHEHVWVDTETYLEIRDDRVAEDKAGRPRQVSSTYGDYRTVDGLRVPYLITIGSGSGPTPDKMQIEDVVLNAPMEDTRFGNPAVPHPRTRARSASASRAPIPTTPSSAPTTARDEPGAAPP